MTTQKVKVYEAINNVQAALAKIGIAKGRKNQQQGYSFRGIDDVYAALAPLLAEHKLCMLPSVQEREVTEKITKSGTTLFYAAVKVSFELVSAEDGSKTTIATVGEAMDSGDKATNKAMSAAYKYAALMTFCIPTEGDNDSENQTHEIAAPSLDDRFNQFWTSLATAGGIASLDILVRKGAQLTNELAAKDKDKHAKLLAFINKRREELSV